MNDEVNIEMENIPLEQEWSEKDFVTDVYHDICKHCHRNYNEGIYRSDFLYNTTSIQNGKFYYLAHAHPIVQIILSSPQAGFEAIKKIGVVGDILNTVYIYDAEAVEACLQKLDELCEEYNLKVIK